MSQFLPSLACHCLPLPPKPRQIAHLRQHFRGAREAAAAGEALAQRSFLGGLLPGGLLAAGGRLGGRVGRWVGCGGAWKGGVGKTGEGTRRDAS